MSLHVFVHLFTDMVLLQRRLTFLHAFTYSIRACPEATCERSNVHMNTYIYIYIEVCGKHRQTPIRHRIAMFMSI